MIRELVCATQWYCHGGVLQYAVYWWGGGILLIPLTYLHQTGDEDEEESWLRIVFDQNLNAAGAGIAAALFEKQVGVQADPVCSRLADRMLNSTTPLLI